MEQSVLHLDRHRIEQVTAILENHFDCKPCITPGLGEGPLSVAG